MAGGGGEGGELDVSLNLTALLDVLTNLLFFLMFGFASSKAAMELDGGVTLPTSSAEAQPKQAVQLTIGRTELRVEKEVLVAIKDGHVAGVKNGANIEQLKKRLLELKSSNNPLLVDSPEILFVLCDKDTSYALLRTVLMTAAEAGFPKYRLAVLTD